jgi:hypothetical protein
MIDNDDDRPPEHVRQAAQVVQSWLDRNKSGGAVPPRAETAAERFSRMPRAATPKPMPAWKDPRQP